MLAQGSPTSRGVVVVVASAMFALVALLSFRSCAGVNASTVGAGTMQLNASGAGVVCNDPTNPTSCTVPLNGAFAMRINVVDFPAGGYNGISWDLSWGMSSGITYLPAFDPALEVTWPGATFPLRHSNGTNRLQGSAWSAGLGSTPSTFKGTVIQLAMNCTATDSVSTFRLLPRNDVTNPLGSAIIVGTVPIPQTDTLALTCAGSAPTPTAPPASAPRVQKLPAVQNVFLSRQGTKVPPARCLDSSNEATLTESISAPITGQLGGFSLQVMYDPSKVCVDLSPSPAWLADPQQVCTVYDSVSAPTLQGIARMNCVTQGKATVIDTNTEAGRNLATIAVRPQPDVYPQIIANQGNGQVVLLDDRDCELIDLQGHPIGLSACEDADVTVRFLEGDVEPDCQVDALDTQAIAFRWGATSGSIRYSNRMNLEPAVPRDQDIDVGDMQFVYGRFGSTCSAPWPPQPPGKPKG